MLPLLKQQSLVAGRFARLAQPELHLFDEKCWSHAVETSVARGGLCEVVWIGGEEGMSPMPTRRTQNVEENIQS